MLDHAALENDIDLVLVNGDYIKHKFGTSKTLSETMSDDEKWKQLQVMFKNMTLLIN